MAEEKSARKLRPVRRRRHGGNTHPRSRREQRDILRQRAKQRVGPKK